MRFVECLTYCPIMQSIVVTFALQFVKFILNKIKFIKSNEINN